MRLSTPTCRLLFSKLKLFCFIAFTLAVYYSATNFKQLAQDYHGGIIITNERDYSSYKMFVPTNPTNCTAHIQETKEYLNKENITFDCKALEEEDCQSTYNDYYEKADPLSVFLRSATCDIEWPQFGSVSQEELNFPLAYFITAFIDARNLELMLATIFRPHNSYCIHIDPKADPIFSRTALQLLYCYRARYPGSYIQSASRNVSVFYMHFSIVEAELICLKDLLDNNHPWSYAVDMAGSEVMLYTNKELVANLSSSEKPEIYTESFPIPKSNLNRIEHKYQFKEGSKFDPDHASSNLAIAKEAPDPIPFNLTIYKGAKSYRLPRHFVDFLLTHPVATSFIEWSTTTAVPDEMVVPTLARISSVKMVNEKWDVEQYYVPQPRYHFQKWYSGCRGRMRNAVCVFSIKDLSTILQSGCYIVNKVRSDYEPYLGECFRDVVRKRETLQ